ELESPERLLNFFVSETSNKKEESVVVALVIEDNGTVYNIKRNRLLDRKSNKTKKESISISYKNNNGEFITFSSDIKQNSSEFKKINRIINKILNKEMARYFLFDGERITNLGNNSRNSKKDIKEAIGAVSGFNVLNNALDSFRELRKSYEREVINKIGDNELSKLKQDIHVIEKKLEKSEEIVNNNKAEIDSITKLINDLDGELVELKEIERAVSDRNKLGSTIKRSKERAEVLRKRILESHLDHRRKRIITSLYGKYSSLDFNENFEEKTISKMEVGAIDEIIERGKCICGEILTDSHIKHLLEQREYQPPKTNGQLIQEFRREIEIETAKLDEEKSRLETDIHEYYRVTDDIEIYESDLKAINE